MGQAAQGLYPQLLKRIPEIADPALRDGVQIQFQCCYHMRRLGDPDLRGANPAGHPRLTYQRLPIGS
jgi:hypothetical protein